MSEEGKMYNIGSQAAQLEQSPGYANAKVYIRADSRFGFQSVACNLSMDLAANISR